jgi:hypothetical protein
MIVDDFDYPSSGWAIPTIARYRSGSLVVGNVEPGSTFIPAPVAFSGSRVVRATASVDGPGASAIGVFCQANLARLFSGYIGDVDTATREVRVMRVVGQRRTVLGGERVDATISLDEPLDLVLRCSQKGRSARIIFAIGKATVVEASDPSPLGGRAGGVFLYHEERGSSQRTASSSVTSIGATSIPRRHTTSGTCFGLGTGPIASHSSKSNPHGCTQRFLE